MLPKYAPSETETQAIDRLRLSVDDLKREFEAFFNGFPGVVIMVCLVIVTMSQVLQCTVR